MYPWIWFWAPQVHFPLGGDVTQRIDPVAQFLQAIPASAGDASVEEQAFGIASYGKQLGWITDVLLDVAKAAPPASAAAKKSLRQLKQAAGRIDTVKQAAKADKARTLQQIESQVRAVCLQDDAARAALRERLKPLLEAS
jgi:hypothetical protein